MLRFIAIGLFLFMAGFPAASQSLKHDFKPQFKTFWKNLSDKDYATSPGAMILDGSRISPGRIWYGTVLQFPREFTEAARGKTILFEFKIKRLSGTQKLNVTNRLWNVEKGGEWKLLNATTLSLNPKNEKEWQTEQIRFSVPNRSDLNIIDFQIGFNPVPNDKTVWILDDACAAEISGDAGLGSNLPTYSIGMADNRKELDLGSAKIVVGDNPTAIAQFAAEEIQEHLLLVTGRKFPIIRDSEKWDGPSIQVGSTAKSRKYYADPSIHAPNHYLIRRIGNDLLISGGDSRSISWKGAILSEAQQEMGTLYAAYEFLERVAGVRWYWPGKLGTVAPKKETLTVGNLFLIGKPSYATRTLFFPVPKDKDLSRNDVLLWQRRLRIGGTGGSPIGMHSFEGWAKKYGKTNPEYFALQADGSRGHLGKGHSTGHVCMSSPEVLKRAIQEKIEFFKKNPDSSYSPIMPGDSDDLFYCRCGDCTSKIKKDHSNLTWGFVNQVATAVAKEFPEKKITCCAYGNYIRRPDFPLHPNVAVTLCFYPTPNANEFVKKRYRDLIQEWKATGATLYVWEYWLPRYGRGVFGAPAIYPRQIQELYLMDQGTVTGRVIELCDIDSTGKSIHAWGDWIYDALNLYVAANLMWDVNKNVDQMLEEFYPAFYGPAASPMKQFYEEMEEAWSRSVYVTRENAVWNWEVCWQKTYPPEFVAKMMGLLRKAVEMSKGREPYYSRTKKTLTGFLPFEENSRLFSGAQTNSNPRDLDVPAAKTLPVIDGRIDDGAWENAAKAENFCDSYNSYPQDASTLVKLLHDNENLYLAVQAGYPAGRTIRWAGDLGSRDAFLWDYEGVEIFFGAPDQEIFQFIISPDDKIADFHHPEKFGGIRWNSGVKAATRKIQDGWTAEIVIPLKDLRFASKKNAPYLFNLYRNHYYKTESGSWRHQQGCWQPPYGPFNNVKRFGTLSLKQDSGK